MLRKTAYQSFWRRWSMTGCERAASGPATKFLGGVQQGCPDHFTLWHLFFSPNRNSVPKRSFWSSQVNTADLGSALPNCSICRNDFNLISIVSYKLSSVILAGKRVRSKHEATWGCRRTGREWGPWNVFHGCFAMLVWWYFLMMIAFSMLLVWWFSVFSVNGATWRMILINRATPPASHIQHASRQKGSWKETL